GDLLVGDRAVLVDHVGRARRKTEVLEVCVVLPCDGALGLEVGQRVRRIPPGPRFCDAREDRKSTRLNSSHSQNSYAVFCYKKKITLTPLRGLVVSGHAPHSPPSALVHHWTSLRSRLADLYDSPRPALLCHPPYGGTAAHGV